MNCNEYIKIFMCGKITNQLVVMATAHRYMGKWSAGNTEAQWNAIRAATSADFNVVGTIIGTGLNNGTTHGMTRTFGLFDLSAIPGVIISARVILDNFYTVGANNCDYVSIQTCPNTGTLTTGDFDNFTPTLLGYDNTKTTQSGDYANQVEFNAAGIAKLNEKGIQQFIFRNGEFDYSNIFPGTSYYGQAGIGTVYLPKLIVETI